MNYSRMYMYEQRGSMHIHKIILLTPRDRRQIVEVTLKVLRDEGTGSDRGGAGRGGGGRGHEAQIKMRSCIEGCAFPTSVRACTDLGVCGEGFARWDKKRPIKGA